MDRAEKVGLGVAVAGHALLFGLLSVGFLSTPNPLKLSQQPVEISLVKDVALEASAPQAVTPPAPSVAPEQGPPEEAAAPAPEEAAPESEPAPAPPEPKPQPEPKSAPPKPAPVKEKPQPAPPKPKPVPAPKPAPVAKPQPPKPAAVAKPEPAKPAKPTPVKSEPAHSASAHSASAKSAAAKGAGKPAPAKPAPTKASGSSATATAAHPRGSRLGADFLKGLTDAPTRSDSQTPHAAHIDARALAGIQDAITRQIQPCADRQVDPGPGANQIVTVLNLKLNPDGTLSATPTVVRQEGVGDENGRYARRVVELGIAAFKGCSPLKLPAEYYSTPNGGWNNINYKWRLR